jgi:hypothetical protein
MATDPASIERVNALCGVYALNRRETSGGHRQEILILGHRGKGAKRTYSTLVTIDVVFRGRFSIMGRTVLCQMTGHRDRSKADMLNVFFAEDDELIPGEPVQPHVLTGILVGLSTRRRLPTVMPFLAIKIQPVNAETLRVGDKSDAELREAMKAMWDSAAIRYKGHPKIETLANEVLKTAVIQPDLAEKARDRVQNGEDLVLDEIREFCKQPLTFI